MFCMRMATNDEDDGDDDGRTTVSDVCISFVKCQWLNFIAHSLLYNPNGIRLALTCADAHTSHAHTMPLQIFNFKKIKMIIM